ncbi:aminoglycoside phosphotransferase family protein [Pseudarthrobacter sp. NamB4]|uniref:aminoglycoside phosphotransferase family protein n=1 Tax=Pseudarthrobacter sp. NamB4 TaxID=2576837 RepID=UPI0010FE9D0F|nr:aminoglycoside phosphotransferase family protein [Pseudarthrobacter sp. NamB4]TLM73758.1 aminoglycoside phosphotransferase family protein [Pseudarthrobacter sp. NamB4]
MKYIDQILRENFRDLDLEQVGLKGRWDILLLTPQFVTSRHVVALIFARGAQVPALVVKIPRQPGDNESVRKEADVLLQLKALGVGSEQGAPEVVGVLNVGGQTVLVETAVVGNLLEPQRVVENFPLAVAAGMKFVAAMPCTRTVPENTDWYERTIAGPLSELASLLPRDAEVAELIDRTHEVLEPLRSKQLPAVVEHGDLSYHNLFLQPNGRLQVVDWERSRLDGLPAHDLIFYLQYIGQSQENALASRRLQLRAFENAFSPGGWAVGPVAEHLRLRNVERDLLPYLVIATWARSTASMTYRLAGQAEHEGEAGNLRTAVTSDRDYWLWRHAVTDWTPPLTA